MASTDFLRHIQCETNTDKRSHTNQVSLLAATCPCHNLSVLSTTPFDLLKLSVYFTVLSLRLL
jgi:hypothetical protein